ncbi:hypothetical protein SAMN04487944_12270 [Gracilibacillus ureilyticus]|uniref:Uncharacterized protein n=1 Tax=Gracilibacillus ureilyticus TaxID=531814 RepID=A0A1H9VB45_9BACI|nr:hypothetical protein [Gracilibacillus ureilyticus]SES18654.1 hypothetical protein SAMN04487944_12270 [Gracilibacillus ureilyticus]
MKIKIYLFLLFSLTIIGLLFITKRTFKSNVGYAIFKPTGVKHEFTLVDLEKKQVIGTVSYKNKTYMTVVVDVSSDTVQVEGSVDELGDLSMNRDSYIDMFKQHAKFFIEENIANPKKYYEELKQQSS